MSTEDAAREVQTREDLAVFVQRLRADLLARSDEWENATLERFLEAFAAWCVDMPGYFADIGEPLPEQPNWHLVARMLSAAAVYE